MSCEKPWNSKSQCQPKCFCIDHVVTGGGNVTARGDCFYEDLSQTLKACGVHAVCVVGVDLYNQTTTGGCERDCYGKKAGKSALIQWEKSGTLGVSQDQTLFVWPTAYRGGAEHQ